MKSLSVHQAEKRRKEIQRERIEIEKAKARLVEREGGSGVGVWMIEAFFMEVKSSQLVYWYVLFFIYYLR